MNEQDIFIAARHLPSAEARDRYLAEACGGDADLRRRVSELLQAEDDAGSFMQAGTGAAYLPTVTEQRLTERPGTVIGHYKLLEQIGEGGFGVVFMAEQTAPVKRKVALKVIKPGMDTREVIARFEAERQALALMDHPHIAKVLDAGATDTGRPFFVMELVRGVPITEYCDQAQLPPLERLELFVTVCQAVQHAHQKGVIHRDIKPTNVLVTQHDDRPVAKVIDFGIAKATSGSLTDKTLFTGFAQMIGTPLYMSPEQAALSAIDVDTRSDIYSLGVLLYELLTGTTPFDKTRLQQAAFDEVRRIIREEEPQKPSTRLSSLGVTLPSVSAQRKTEPRKLSQLVQGDLDWIVMKAIEKDRTRRYDTANGFAADILRYLADEPVMACPPSATYRFRKFARRNKAGIATAAMVAAALVVGIIGTTWQAIRATHEADRATTAEDLADRRYTAERATREQADAAREETEQQRLIAEQNFDKARRAVDEYLTQVTESELLTVPGLQPLRQKLLEAALGFYTEFTQEQTDDPTLQRDLAWAYFRLGLIYSELGNADESQRANSESIRLYEELRDAGRLGLDMQVELAWAYLSSAQYDAAVKLCQDVLLGDAGNEEARSLLGNTYNNLANDESESNDIEAALYHHRLAFELRESLVRDAPDNPKYLAQLGGTLNNLGILLKQQGSHEEALAMFTRAVEYLEQAYEPAPHSIRWGRWLCICLVNVADTQAVLGEDDEALASYQRLVVVSRKRAFENPAVISLRGEECQAYLKLARFLQALGNETEAAQSFREAREVLENIPRTTPDQLYELATVYAALSQPSEGAIGPSEDELAERQRHIELTLQTLHQAVDAGYSNVQAVNSNRLFDVMREQADFQQLMLTLEMAAEAEQLARQNAATIEQTLVDQLRAAELLANIVVDHPGAQRHRVTLAAALHSIGVIQTELKQFAEAEQSLNDALELRRSLLEFQPDSLQTTLDALSTRSAIGQLYWESGRHEEAHRLWQDILADCRQVVADHPTDTTLQTEIATMEWTICQKYGEIGLWELAGYSVDQCLQSGQVQNLEWDCRGVHLLAAQGRMEDHREFCRLIADKWGQANAAHVVWAATMNPQSALESDALLALAEGVVESTSDPMLQFHAATAFYRSGEYERALELMLPFREHLSNGGSAYLHWYAMVYHQLGQDLNAAQCLEEAEEKYLRIASQCLQAPDASAVNDGHGGYWWAWAEDQAMRQASWDLIHGQGSLKDPWQHLIQARGYRLIGEIDKSEAELALAASNAPEDPDLRLARARLFEQWGDFERAEGDWQRAVDVAGDDPMPWIQRGRWYAARGEHEKADADFARAASLTPNELNRFLEAGWWVVGPYPVELREFCPPEIGPDPSRPEYTIEPGSGLSEQPVGWQAVVTGERGEVELGSVIRTSGASGYAMAMVHAPQETTRLLRLGHPGPGLRLWLNGELIYDSTETPWHYPQMAERSVAVTLRAGRNAFLVKAPDQRFIVRMGDSAADRATTLAERGLWEEAHRVFQTDEARDLRTHPLPWCLFLQLLVLQGDLEGYARQCTELFEQFGNTGDSYIAFWVARACSLAPNPVIESHADRIMALAEMYQSDAMGTFNKALAAYRAGQYDLAASRLEQIPEGGDTSSLFACQLGCLVEHKRGNAQRAREWMHKLEQYAGQQFWSPPGPGFYWHNHALYWVLRLETEGLLTDARTPGHATLQEFREHAATAWRDLNPDTEAFDHAVAFNPYSPSFRIARGLRLAQLGRFDEAETDFNTAVELTPNDVDVLLARARFHAERGDFLEAERDFDSALAAAHAAPDPENFALVRRIENELGRHDDVVTDWQGRTDHSHHNWLSRVRGQRQILLGNWQTASEYLAQGEHWSHDALLAPLYCLLDDEESFRKICEVQLSRMSAEWDAAGRDYFRMEMLSLRSTTGDDAAELARLMELRLSEFPNWRLAPLGAALYRSGRYDEALQVLNDYLGGHDSLQRDARAWPLLAMTHWQLGNHDEARRWLNRTAWWIDLFRRKNDVPEATGFHDADCRDWLYTNVFFTEARALIGEDSEAPLENLSLGIPPDESFPDSR